MADASGATPAARSSKKRARSEEEAPVTTATAVDDAAGDDADGAGTAAGPVAPIAVPLAGKKLTKRLYKLVKKAAVAKVLRRGVKEVVKAIRKGEKGLVVLAGDISPIDVISHLPVLCEDAALPFVFTASKAELGAAAATKRPTSVVFVSATLAKKAAKPDKDGKARPAFDAEDKLAEAIAEVKGITPVY